MTHSSRERSQIYRAFAAAFRDPQGGIELFDEGLLPPPPPDAEAAFLAAYDTAVSRDAASLFGRSHSSRSQADLFEELVRWYSHFGLKRQARAELPDHLAVELDFMHVLTWREHLQAGDAEAMARLRTAQAEFLRRHLTPLASAVAQALDGSPEAGNRDRYAALPVRLLNSSRWSRKHWPLVPLWLHPRTR